MQQKSRAEYMKKRREGKKNFVALIDRNKAAALEEKLQQKGKTKATWLEEKIEEEIRSGE